MTDATGKRGQPAAWRSGVTLAVLAAICTALVATTWRLTAPRIEANEKAYLTQSLRPALANVFYDNELEESTLVIPAPHDLPGSNDAVIYRLYAENRPVAAVFVVSARDGYSGPIRLLIGIEHSGQVTGVQVLEHRETPGLGDRIETSKSDWLLQFAGASLEKPPLNRWAIRRDGGDFDQLTGASVTPRAVVRAVKETLVYFAANRDSVFAASTDDDAAVKDEQATDSQE